MGKVKAGGEGGEAENGNGKKEKRREGGRRERVGGGKGGGESKQIYVTPLTLQSLYAAR